MKRWKQFLIVVSILGIGLGFAIFKMMHEADLAAELGFFNSLSHELNRHPEPLDKLEIFSQEGMHELDEKANSELVKTMLEKYSVDCGRRLRWRLNRKIAQQRLNSMFKIQILSQQNGKRSGRVLTPGPDGIFYTTDDEIFAPTGASASAADQDLKEP